jgi:gliding motility-associated-like protein
MRKAGLSILLLILSFAAIADTFTVIRRADDTDPGSLRWAITSANSNAPSAIPDSIVFDIPNANSQASRTIVLSSELPALTSNIYIDGTTQSSGSPVGFIGPRIFLAPESFNLCRRGLIIEDAENIEIYGLGFLRFINSDPTQPEDYRDGIFMKNVRNIRIGGPDKGNSFIGCYYGIRHIPEAIRNPTTPYYAANITIQGNTMGPQPNPPGGGNPGRGLVQAILLENATAVKIGGWQRAEENTIMAILNGIFITTRTRSLSDLPNIDVVNNTLYPGKLPPNIPFTIPLTGISIENVDPDSILPYKVVVSGNIMRNTGMNITSFKAPLRIVRNRISCFDDTSQANTATGIALSLCDSGLIGGTDSANIIRDAAGSAVLLINCKYITVSKNSIFCSAEQGNNVFTIRANVPRITSLVVDAAGVVSGKTCAGCAVEVFTTQACPNLIYNGQTYKTTVIADASGDWSYADPTNCQSSFTTTDALGTTSRFYAYVDFLFDATTVVRRNSTCGRSNGSITGVIILPGVIFHWEDEAGNIISRDTNLLNIPAGVYRLVCTKENVSCTRDRTFTILDFTPVIHEQNLVRRNPVPGCTITGAITGLSVTGAPLAALRLQWFNAAGGQVGSTLSLLNVPQGDYTLRVSVITDTNCYVLAGPYTLRDVAAPVMVLTDTVITSATCGLANGSIRGIRITDGWQNPVYRWFNNSNVVVATTPDLQNALPGKYYLEYDDAAPCPPLRSPVFEIANNGLITIDASALEIVPSGCTVVRGAIKNIIVTGASRIEWVDLSNGEVIGTQPDLLNVPTGNYRLRAFDQQWGCADSTSVLVVPVTPVIPLIMATKSVKDEFCSAANGYIQGIAFSNLATGYRYKWVKNGTDSIAATLDITGLTKGDYTLFAYDSNGCEQRVIMQTIRDHPSPQISEQTLQVKPDICNQQIGSIQNLRTEGGDAPLTYTWYAASGTAGIAQGLNLTNRLAGNYYMIVRDANGCADTSSTIVLPNESPVIEAPEYEEVYVKRNTSSTFKPLNPANEGRYEFFENTFAPTPFLTNTDGKFTTPVLSADRFYYVRRVVGSCASETKPVKITVIDFSQVRLPNAFTPNADGQNDVFRIRVFGKIIIDQFVVLNRWGQTVFATGDQRRGWDGTMAGKPQPADTYVWMLKGADIDGTPIFHKGTVVLIR